jgi:cytochrome c-type biogenesis protein CcmH/NrfG
MLAVVTYSHFFASDTETHNTPIKRAHLDSIVPASNATDKKIASVSDLTTKLAERLETSPDDPSGWLLLARSYEHIQEQGKAREAYAKAMHYGASDAELEKRLAPISGAGQ